MSDHPHQMRIVFMGTPDFAVPSLDILIANNYAVVGVVTVADKPAGRGQHISVSPVKVAAQYHHVETILQPEKLSDPTFIEQLTTLKPDLFVVVAFRILPPAVFGIPRSGAFNLHASLLPKYRGAAPINWAIINGEKETGVTTFFLQEKVDTGNIILQARTVIRLDQTAGELHDALAEIGAEIVLHTVRLIEAGKATPRHQDDNSATPAPKIFRDHCRIDWSKSAMEIHNLIRGLSPRPCAFTFHGDVLFKLYKSKVAEVTHHEPNGKILHADNQLVVSTGKGAIELLEIQQEGKKKLTVEEFLRGYRLHSGDLFS
jgi:methionyl-tRNA formyltransferase